jgi:ABC-type protease/lipase transport system fused ATPase/permease subunit
LTAFLDAPWVPIFVALIWVLHPMLGLVAVSSAAVLFSLSIVNEVATRKANETANRKQIEVVPNVVVRLCRIRFEAVFKQFGLPKAIRTDNGVPFASPN